MFESASNNLTQFVDDDWLAANDLLPPTPPETLLPPQSPTLRAKDPFSGATIASLRLKPVTSISSASPCAEAVETMREKGFDQLPVCSSSPSSPHKLVGLVTLGNLLSYLSSGRAQPSDPVKTVMFNFTTIKEVVTDPMEVMADHLTLDSNEGGGEDNSSKEVSGEGSGRPRRRKFLEITTKTPLSALNRFFEWNSAAVVTERQANGEMKAVAVVTKVDLLSWLVRMDKNS